MPHFIAEYSKNLDDKIDFDAFFTAIIDTMVTTGIFPLGGIRCRAIPVSHYRIATGDKKFEYIHMTLKIGAGRDADIKKMAGDKIFATITDQLQQIYDDNLIAISFEIVELDPILNYKKNNIHTYLQTQGDSA